MTSGNRKEWMSLCPNHRTAHAGRQLLIADQTARFMPRSTGHPRENGGGGETGAAGTPEQSTVMMPDANAAPPPRGRSTMIMATSDDAAVIAAFNLTIDAASLDARHDDLLVVTRRRSIGSKTSSIGAPRSEGELGACRLHSLCCRQVGRPNQSPPKTDDPT